MGQRSTGASRSGGPAKAKVSGFADVNAYLKLYGKFTGKGHLLAERMNSRQKLGIQQTFFRVRQTYGLEQGEIADICYFMLVRDPLGMKTPTAYSQPSVLMQVAPHYLRWKRESEELIKQLGLSRAIAQGADEFSEVDEELYALMEELKEEID